MDLNFGDHQLHIDCYTQLLNTHLMVTTNQKQVIRMQRKKGKGSKCITKEGQQTMKYSNRRIRENL